MAGRGRMDMEVIVWHALPKQFAIIASAKPRFGINSRCIRNMFPFVVQSGGKQFQIRIPIQIRITFYGAN